MRSLICFAYLFVTCYSNAAVFSFNGSFQANNVPSVIVGSGNLSGSFSFSVDIDPNQLNSLSNLPLSSLSLSQTQISNTQYDLGNTRAFFLNNPIDAGGAGNVAVSIGGAGGLRSSASSIVQNVDDWRMSFNLSPLLLTSITHSSPASLNLTNMVFTRAGQFGFFNVPANGSVVVSSAVVPVPAVGLILQGGLLLILGFRSHCLDVV